MCLSCFNSFDIIEAKSTCKSWLGIFFFQFSYIQLCCRLHFVNLYNNLSFPIFYTVYVSFSLSVISRIWNFRHPTCNLFEAMACFWWLNWFYFSLACTHIPNKNIFKLLHHFSITNGMLPATRVDIKGCDFLALINFIRIISTFLNLILLEFT